jgi:hypothetical protein
VFRIISILIDINITFDILVEDLSTEYIMLIIASKFEDSIIDIVSANSM